MDASPRSLVLTSLSITVFDLLSVISMEIFSFASDVLFEAVDLTRNVVFV